jgi:beta-phosphoglucomutase-like phosphatase (HAD superfamily)
MTPETAEAQLFDCDGTLVHSLVAYERAWTHAFDQHGVQLTPEWYRERVGLSPRALIEAAAHDYETTVDVDALEALAVTAYVDSAHTVLANDPVLDIARAHHGRVPLAVVSGGPRAGVVAALAAVGVVPGL